MTRDAAGDLTNLGICRDLLDNQEATKSILIVGDGNFSYACAFVRSVLKFDPTGDVLGRMHIRATSLDTHEELLRMYPGAAAHFQELHGHSTVRVLHGINGTKLDECKDTLGISSFDRIVFNFPHYAEGGNKRNKINKHRQLLTQFFQSCTSVLASDGQVWVTLCAGQGGTPEEIIVRPVGDTWQVAQCAASAALMLFHVHPVPTDALFKLGYNSVGHRLQEKAFRTHDSLTHIFCRESLGILAHHPLTWTRDISFWIGAGFTEDKMAHVVEDVYGPKVDVCLEHIDEYTNDQGRYAKGYRLTLSSRTMALSKEYVNTKTDEVTDVLDIYEW
ncbi:hypothetical protein H310_06407 [Aphanomyces invadans]|uniref:25S rRNA (uridine-N(3))-methyltransferase BMT5-like domain-containing protein n=1 Tax=Aphanomyces invadans TaxID=157072 RepID=A0A024U611_9STRA|nr:hypothetical protein H310_06407 [Aphanomyces invadans]ETW01836.1 hypothetical protein H310_06407 [Aphanomyces invadans]|eukprot:XP_008869684.1 hypothetical protein H310_06407 [Aphanomyces invadans]